MSESSKAREQKELETLERGRRGIELRKGGLSYRAIAARLKAEGVADVTYQTVRRDCKAALKLLNKHRLEETKEYQELQVIRLEGLLLAHYPQAIGKAEIEIDKNGQTVIDPKTKQPKIIVTDKPDVSSGWLSAALIRDLSELLGLKAAAKSDVKINVSELTDGELEAVVKTKS